MHFEVYADSFLVLQFVMNCYLLGLVNRMLRQSISRKRILCGALGGAILSLFPFLLPLKLIYCVGLSFFLSVLCMAVVTFHTYGGKSILLLLEKFSVSTMLLGGGLMVLLRILPKRGDSFLRVAGILAAGGVLYGLLVRFFKRGTTAVEVCKVTLFGREEVMVEALLDTGNSLTEPISGKPVAVLDKDTFESIFGEEKPSVFRIIPYHSIGKKSGVLPGYRLDRIKVEIQESTKEYRDVYVGISEEIISRTNTYKMIMHPGMLQ